MHLFRFSSKINSYYEVLKKDKFFAGGTVLTIAIVLSGSLGYAYQIMLGVLLTPTDFAIFSAIISLYVFLASPFNSLYMMLSRAVAMQLNDSDKKLYRYYQRALFLITVILIIPFAIFLYQHDVFNRYLGVTEWYIVPILLGFVWLYGPQIVCNAFFQGMQKFKILASIMFFSIFIKIISTGFFLSYVEPSVLNAMLGLGLSAFIILFICIIYLKRLLINISEGSFSNLKQHLKINTKQVISFIKGISPFLLAGVGFTGMTQLDMFFVNYYFASPLAGSYAAASVFGKVILYLPGGLAMALYPMVAKNHSNQLSSFLILKKALLATFISSAVLCLFFYFFSNFFISIFYENKYPDAYLILKWYGFAMVPMALILILENFFLAKGDAIFSWIFLVVFPLQVIAIKYFHSSPSDIIITVGISGLTVFLAGSILIIYKYKLFEVLSGKI